MKIDLEAFACAASLTELEIFLTTIKINTTNQALGEAKIMKTNNHFRLYLYSLAVLSSSVVSARWLELQQWKRTLSMRPNFETSDISEDFVVTDSFTIFTDYDDVWMSGGCANGVVSDKGSFLRTVRYSASNPNPMFPFVLAAIEVHSGDDCMDENPVYVEFQTGPNEEEAELMQFYNDPENQQQPDWVPYGQTLDDVMNAPTIPDDNMEEYFEEDPFAFDDDMVVAEMQQMDEVFNDQDEYNDDEGSPQPDYDSGESTHDLKKRNPAPPSDSGSDDLMQGPPANNIVPLDSYLAEQVQALQDFLDETTPSMSGTGMYQQEEDFIPLESEDVLDLEPLIAPHRDIPIEDNPNEIPIVEVNMLQKNLRFGSPTSIRFVSDISQWYRVPGGGIDAFEHYIAKTRLHQSAAAA
ncbi:hypothetical protein H072_657 [Dactylellina haptotyla CBS 200.50]|uniref:Uncharacterized protein n=1 Tax=Dactylellina haptotyla (strain CBS 200.50) TaxID=1284197 RepID=S8AR97_DACHA|nr:hypothetical protein H072_657 [Dactylellina haptotyla CBS 200.50]